MLLITDGTRVLLIQDSTGLALPSQRQWPVTLKPPKNNWPLALARHISFNCVQEWPEYQKQKRAFGMPDESLWYVFLIGPTNLDAIVHQTKKTSEWFFRYASARIPWSLKIADLHSIIANKLSCEVMSAHCIREYLQKTTNTAEGSRSEVSGAEVSGAEVSEVLTVNKE